MVCFRYINVNTLHKGDNDNNNKQKYCKRKTIGNADYVTSLRKHKTTLYQRAQYWQKNNTSKDMIRVCTQLRFNVCKEIGVKVDS
jgi:hypothetical protein